MLVYFTLSPGTALTVIKKEWINVLGLFTHLKTRIQCINPDKAAEIDFITIE